MAYSWKGKTRRNESYLLLVYFRTSDLMMYAYLKSKQEDLTPNQLKALKAVIEED